MQYHSSPYQGQQAAVLALYSKDRPVFDINPYPSREQLEKAFAAEGDAAENFRLWLDETGELAAYALVDLDLCNLIFEMRPGAAQDVLPAIVAWSAERVRAANAAGGENNTLDTLCFPSDPERDRLLLANGFERIEGDTVRLLRSLHAPIPEPQFPPGFIVRGCQDEVEAEQYATLHRAAFGTKWMTTERRLELMREPGYDPELDLVAVAPDGTWAAYVVGNWDTELAAPDGGKLGWTDPIGTHPDFRRRGLSRNLVAQALQMLKARGATYAAVGTLSSNTAMLGVLLGLDFKEIQRFYWYSKAV